MAVWVTSDLHIGHDKEFMYGPRGFSNIDEHDVALIENWNRVVARDDVVYILGDLMLGDNVHGMEVLRKLNGYHCIILGNHDTDTRIKRYKNSYIIPPVYAQVIKHNGFRFYLSHYPTLTSNYDGDKPLKARTINLCGHTHTKDRFVDMDKGLIYHVELDCHDNTPVLLDDIIVELQEYNTIQGNGMV